MNWLNATNSLEQLELLNSSHSDRKILPVPGTNNTLLVNANLLDDCEPGQYWEDYGDWLKSLPVSSETPVPPPPDID